MLSNDVESMLEERAKLENDVRIAQLDLDNYINLNEEAIQDNLRKELKLAELESIKIQLDTDLPSDLRLLSVERLCLYERYEYDIATQELRNKILEYQVLWRNDIEKETTYFLDQISKLRDEATYAFSEHVEAMHSLNVSLFKKERKLEESFRAAVHGAYRAHNERALTALSHADLRTLEKRRHLINELEIQRVGISSLKAKIIEHEGNCNRLVQHLEISKKEAEVLRQEFSLVDESKMLSVDPSDTKAVGNTRQAGDKTSLNSSPYNEKTRQNVEYLLWSNRYSALVALKEELRVVRVANYPFQLREIHLQKSFSCDTAKTQLIMLREVAEGNADFNVIISPLLPFLQSFSGVTNIEPKVEANVISWLALKFIEIWSFKNTSEVCELSATELQSELKDRMWLRSKNKLRVSSNDYNHHQTRIARFIDAGKGISVLGSIGIPLPVIGIK